MSGRRRFIVCVLVYHFLLHYEIKTFCLHLVETSAPSYMLRA